MKTLLVAPFSPYPQVFGGAIRLHNLLLTFREFSDVSLVAFSSWSDDPSNVITQLEALCDEVVLVENEQLSRARKAVAVLGRNSLQSEQRRSTRFQGVLNELLGRERFDVVVIELTPMARFDVSAHEGPVILDLQNIEHELARRRADVAGSGMRRLALECEWRKVRREELEACRRFDLVFAPSQRECDLLSEMVPDQQFVEVPNSIDPDRIESRSLPSDSNEIVFVGATHVDANRDGVIWFVEEILPLVREVITDVKVTIVGGHPSRRILGYGQQPHIEVTGYVDDVQPYLHRAGVLIVPLRSGGGTRLKLLEGLCAGVPTVSTSVGAEGLELLPGEHLLIGDDAPTFARRIVEVIGDPLLRARLSVSGRSRVEEKYSWRTSVGLVESAVVNAIAAYRCD